MFTITHAEMVLRQSRALIMILWGKAYYAVAIKARVKKGKRNAPPTTASPPFNPLVFVSSFL